MTRKNIVVTTVLIVVAVIIVLLGVLLSSVSKNNSKNENSVDIYNKIIEKINNKESFNLLITKNDNYRLKKEYQYYKDAYRVKNEHLKADFTNDTFKKLVKLLTLTITKEDEMSFVVIKNGEVENSLIGDFGEKALKNLLISSKVIGKEYADVDTLMEGDLKVYKNDKIYNILYIDRADKNLFKYREILVKNKIKSLIVFAGSLEQYNVVTEIENKLKLNEETKYPILVKLKKGNIDSKYANVNLDNLLEECKK